MTPPHHAGSAQRADREDRPEHLASWYTPGLSDGMGDRLLMFDNSTASSLELLRFRPEFSRAPGFEAALRHRVEELAHFSHPGVAKVRTVESLGEEDGLALVSNHTAGRRLSELTQDARGAKLATELIRQLTPVLAALHEQGKGIAHGLLTPERIIVTPEGRLVIVEHVLGAALETLRLPDRRLRSEMGLASPPGSTSAGTDARADVVQLGYIALSLLAGRRIGPIETTGEIMGVLDREAEDIGMPAPPHLRRWLLRALQMDGAAFASASEAHLALTEWPDDRELDSGPRAARLTRPAAPASWNPLLPRPHSSAAADGQVASAGRHTKVEPINRPGAPIFEPRQTGAPPPSQVHAAKAKIEPFYLPSEQDLAEQEPDSADADAAIEPIARTRSHGRGARWAIIGLSTLSLCEGMVIAGLILSREPADRPAAGDPRQAAVVDTAAPVPAAGNLAPAGRAGAAPTVQQGRLEIASDPPGARVTVDGKALGNTPLTVPLSPGEHNVVIAAGGGTTRRTVNVAAGATSTLMASLAPAGASGGWVTIDVPLEMQVHEGDTLLGTTRAARIMLPAGSHQLRLSNAALNFQETIRVDIQAGRTVTSTLAIPSSPVSLNALPWANVWLDGQALGTTPVANVSVPIGTHEIVWRHPELGERRQTVVVTARNAVRVVIDLRK